MQQSEANGRIERPGLPPPSDQCYLAGLLPVPLDRSCQNFQSKARLVHGRNAFGQQAAGKDMSGRLLTVFLKGGIGMPIKREVYRGRYENVRKCGSTCGRGSE